MTNLKEKLAADDPEALEDLEDAAEESKKAKEAKARKERRANTKYGSMLEENEDQ